MARETWQRSTIVMRVLVNAANLYVADTYNQTIRLIQ